jgi:predicted RecB family nuclease
MHNTQRSGAITKKETSLSSLPLQKNDVANARFVVGCSHREVNNRNPEYSNLPRRSPDDQQQMRMDEGILFEQGIFQQLCELHKVSPMREHHEPEGATSSAMKRGDKIIIGPELPTINHRSGKPDILVRHGDSPMENGLWAYIPIDVKNSKALEGTRKARPMKVSQLNSPWVTTSSEQNIGVGKPKEDHSLQLAHYWLMLVDLGHAPNIEPIAGIIDSSCSVVWRDLDDGKDSFIAQSLAEWNERWAAITAMREGGELRTRAVYRAECEECPWHDICENALIEEQHVSLVEGVGVVAVAKLADAGIETIPQLAALDHSMLDANPTLPYFKGLERHVDAARVVLHGGTFPFSKRNASLPHVPRADVEIDFDVENDDVLYLLGNYITQKQPDGSYDNGKFVSFHYFDRSDPDEEGRQLAAFWKWLYDTVNETQAAGKTVAVYCYAGSFAEIPRMKEASARNSHVPGVPSIDEIANLANEPWWVDMHLIVKELHWPTRKLGLKYVAKLSGFSWDAEDAGGGNSIVWYRQACDPSDPESAALQAKLLRYNEDDVQATLYLRRWLHQGITGGDWTLQSVTTLPPPNA